VLTGQSQSCMIRTHKYSTHTEKGSRFVFCIIYEMLPLSLVLHLESTECQEKSRESAHAAAACVRACAH